MLPGLRRPAEAVPAPLMRMRLLHRSRVTCQAVVSNAADGTGKRLARRVTVPATRGLTNGCSTTAPDRYRPRTTSFGRADPHLTAGGTLAFKASPCTRWPPAPRPASTGSSSSSSASSGEAATSSSRSGWMPGSSRSRWWRRASSSACCCWARSWPSRASSCRAQPRMYGHLVVMGLFSVALPFIAHHLGRAERRLQPRRGPHRRRAAVRHPLRRDPAADRADHVQRGARHRHRSRRSGRGGRLQPGQPGGDRAGGAAGPHRCGGLVCARRRLRQAQRAGPATDDPGLLPGRLRAGHDRHPGAPARAPVGGHADRERDLRRHLARPARLGRGLPDLLPAPAQLGSDAHLAGGLPAADLGHRARGASCSASRSTSGSSPAPRWSSPGSAS